ncbi:hypothetical protein H6F67_07035 [Microcoleus sp. FACHB-1515]|uniref:HHL1-like protein n=1 Tax=Cyanophyceae TaxID=3028117 RepID=UPI001685636A|nr:HHL1-like protein [Microcoleus sp. FACHB-1515]MBD2089605.1 hypothetical protein [Microcoleus sp. FACHB-1515]
MTKSLGFGKTPPAPKVSKRTTERDAAVKQYDKMKSDGIPDFEIYIRIQGKKAWYPVGALAVKRSSLINRAIFDSQEQLLQGAFRLYPVLRKNQNQLEYGYRLKEFKDEPIQLAVKPEPPVQSAIAGLRDRATKLFKRG